MGRMLAARLYGPADVRIEDVPHPGQPGPGEALVRVKAVGICGSDMHVYQDGRIGDTVLSSPIIQGHEFSGVVESVGPDAADGMDRPLAPGMHVAVDPAQSCGRCELCEAGHPNLCLHVRFCGLSPHDGALCESIRVPSRTCFPVPAGMDFGEVTLLETMGVALHTMDLAKPRVGDSLAIIGAGPIGLCILQLARMAGARPVFVSERLPWRAKLATRLGGIAIDAADPAADVMRQTRNRGVDVAIEAAWADSTVQHAADMLRLGGRLVLAGIPSDDRLTLRHSTARRKGLDIRMVRRMKLVYPRVIELARTGVLDLASLISHHFPLLRAAEAFALNARYGEGVVKVVIDV